MEKLADIATKIIGYGILLMLASGSIIWMIEIIHGNQSPWSKRTTRKNKIEKDE